MKKVLKRIAVIMSNILPAVKQGTCFLLEDSTYRAVDTKNLRVEAVRVPFDGVYYYFDAGKVRRAEKLR